MTQAHCEVIVLGLGGMGSAVLYQLARRGVNVCGIERFGVAHARGSSHGQTRIIRKAYLEHPDYVPLLQRAYQLWGEIEGESGRELLVKTGLFSAGVPNSEAIRGLEVCYRHHRLPHERLDPAAIQRRYPQFSLPEDWVGFLDPEGGFLRVEDCVETHIELARRHGAEIRTQEAVRSWRPDGGGVVVETERANLRADRLVVTTGAWAQPLLAGLGVEATILRKVLFWYETDPAADFSLGRLPCFLLDWRGAVMYGFPAQGRDGMKVAEHSLTRQRAVDPDHLDRDLAPRDEAPVRQFIEEFFAGLQVRRQRHAVCMYTTTPDGHFALDVHPQYRQVVLGAGFSGHGFKFASVIGEILADLAERGTTAQPIGFLRLGRFAG